MFHAVVLVGVRYPQCSLCWVLFGSDESDRFFAALLLVLKTIVPVRSNILVPLIIRQENVVSSTAPLRPSAPYPSSWTVRHLEHYPVMAILHSPSAILVIGVFHTWFTARRATLRAQHTSGVCLRLAHS